MKRITMSQAERDRPDYSNRARDQKVTQREAAKKMGATER